MQHLEQVNFEYLCQILHRIVLRISAEFRTLLLIHRLFQLNTQTIFRRLWALWQERMNSRFKSSKLHISPNNSLIGLEESAQCLEPKLNISNFLKRWELVPCKYFMRLLYLQASSPFHVVASRNSSFPAPNFVSFGQCPFADSCDCA